MMDNSSTTFQKLTTDNDIKEIIQSAFDITLDVQGGWGYDQDDSMIIKSCSMPVEQLQHALASMRSHIEMNMTLPPEKRYGGINVTETKREQLKTDIKNYDIVTYQISGMPEKVYTQFIDEYKNNQDAIDFDIQDHFDRRNKETLIRNEVFWFDVTQIQ